MFVNILGTRWKIETRKRDKDPVLEDCGGYSDHTTKRIVLREKEDGDNVDDFGYYQRKTLRHEIVHAFMYESGLHDNFEHPEIGVEETMIDWIAIQFPKMLEVFKKADCL